MYWHLDIEATVNSIQIEASAGGASGGGVALNCPDENTDYQAEYETTESEVEAILQDSVEECYSFSDTEETWQIIKSTAN